MDQVVRDRRPVVVSRKDGEAVVIVPLADWNATAKTTYLLYQKLNATRLGEAITELDAGKGEEDELMEPWSSTSPPRPGRTTYIGRIITQKP